MKEYIELGWHTVPLKGKLERLDDGSKTIPRFEEGWKARYQKQFNKTASDIGGAITGEVSGIIAIDCDNPETWKLFRSLDPSYEFVFLSRGKGYDAGTIIYKFDDDLANTWSISNGEIALDFYSNNGFVYLPTQANKTKVPLGPHLPKLQEAPACVKILLKQLEVSTKPKTSVQDSTNVITANCLNPSVKQFVDKREFMPGLFKVITPRDFRDTVEYVELGYLHPNKVPSGRGSEYLSKVSAILGADISIDEELYVNAMDLINQLFDSPMPSKRLESTVLNPMLDGKAAINGKAIWQYNKDWSDHRLILQGKRHTALELGFDDKRNMYYVVDEVNQRHRAFNRDSEMMSYIEAAAVSSPKKLEIKRALPLINVSSAPNLAYGFNQDEDPTARMLNTFVQTPELMVFNHPELYLDKYTPPTNTLKYLETLVPDDSMRKYLLSFVATKLKTFKYSPVILFFMGAHGSGKDLFVGLLETIIGHVSRPTTKEFLELFNGWLLDSYFIQLDEYGNQLTSAKEREEALGKIKAYTGKQNVQVRAMRTDGFMYKHNATFIMTANKNPLMLEDGDRRVLFLHTPNKLDSQQWVLDKGGVAEVFNLIQSEVKDFCYYLATEVPQLSSSDYVKPPETEAKHKLIADSMHAAGKIAYAIKHGMKQYLIDLAEEFQSLDNVVAAIENGDLTTVELNHLYDELTEFNGNHRNFFKVLKGSGLELRPTTRDGQKAYRVISFEESPFADETVD